MKNLTRFSVNCLLLVIAISSWTLAQSPQRFTEGEFAGFTKSPTEHIIVRLDEPFTVRSVQGQIVSKTDNTKLSGAIFEVRVPGSNKIIGCVADKRGRFKFPNLQPGTYVFKATKDGFQSVTGTIVVSKRSSRGASISIAMELGV